MLAREIVRMVGCTLATLGLCGLAASASQHPTSSPVNESHIKLERFGWKPPVPPHPGRTYGNNSEIDSLPSQQLTIDSEGRVLVSFTTRGRNPEKGLLKRSHPTGILFHIIRFTGDGEADLSLELPTNNWLGNGVYVDDRDDIIARADDKLQILITGPEQSGRQPQWKNLAPCGRYCSVVQSPSRRTLRLSSYAHTWDTSLAITILDLHHPSEIRRCREPMIGADSVTDDFAYSNFDQGNPPMPPPVLYRWPLCRYGQRTRLPVVVHGIVHAISDTSLLLGETIYSPDGEKKRSCSFRKVLAKHEDVWPRDLEGDWGMSRNGTRVAIIAGTYRGGSRRFGMWGLTVQRIIPYDMTTCKSLESIPISPYAFLQLAMSPDGHRVATLVRDTVTIADVP